MSFELRMSTSPNYYALDAVRFERFCTVPARMGQADWAAFVQAGRSEWLDEWGEESDVLSPAVVPTDGGERVLSQSALAGRFIFTQTIADAAVAHWSTPASRPFSFLWSEWGNGAAVGFTPAQLAAYQGVYLELIRPDLGTGDLQPFWLLGALAGNCAGGGLASPQRIAAVVARVEAAGGIDDLVTRLGAPRSHSPADCLRSLYLFARDAATAGCWLIGSEDAT